MKYLEKDIIHFMERSGFESSSLGVDTALGDDLDLWGDDLDELLSNYAQEFGVDMSSYLWYFHSTEEGWNTGALFFKPPNKRVDHIPITIDLMTRFANMGAWLVKYPDHKLPRYRLDIFINRLLVTGFVIYLIILLVKESGR